MASAYVGTSGFSYDEWRGGFYPPGLPRERMLEHYASRLPSVEIDATFYRMPSQRTLDQWCAATPASFRFALKASRRITHFERLVVPSESLAYLLSLLPRLGPRLGAVLFQLPPYLHHGPSRLSAFLDALPPALPVAFEFRDPSWHVEEIYALLAQHGAALCLDDRDDAPPPPMRVTAPFTYVRLRRSDYREADLERWLDRFREWLRGGVDVLAFVKHEGSPAAPGIACELVSRLAAPRPSQPGLRPSSASSAGAAHA